MSRLVLTVLLAVLASSATAAEWAYEGGSVPIAYTDNGAAQLQFACRGGDLTLGFWVRAPHNHVASAASMNLVITPDPASGTEGTAPAGSSFAQDMPLIHSDGTSMIVRGPVAKQWARIAQKTRQLVRVAYVHKSAKGKLEIFDSNAFSAKGSSSAISKVLDRCG